MYMVVVVVVVGVAKATRCRRI